MQDTTKSGCDQTPVHGFTLPAGLNETTLNPVTARPSAVSLSYTAAIAAVITARVISSWHATGACTVCSTEDTFESDFDTDAV